MVNLGNLYETFLLGDAWLEFEGYPRKIGRFYHLPFQTISQARNILLITKLLQSKQKIKYLLISLHISLFGCIFGCQFSNTPNYEY